MEEQKKQINFQVPSENEIGGAIDSIKMEDARRKMANTITVIRDVFQNSADIAKGIYAGMSQFVQVMREVSVSITPVLEVIREVLSNFSQVVSNIHITGLSEERKQELLHSHTQWGELGWTWFLDAPMDFYHISPIDSKSAYERVKPFCTKQQMERLFNNLHNRKIRKTDLDSAIFCYQNRQYKACSLLLFGLIDSNLIRKMPKTLPGKKHRPSGFGAIKKLQEKKSQEEMTLFSMLHFVNLISCLKTFFADGHDFKEEPATINRNFIDHGMNRRAVRKKDCIQLFLALNNLMLLFEYY